jgi:hypothetical protein
MLDGRVYSGGLTDIIRGILSMYKFSKEISFDFKINFCYPYNLQDYLVPNLYNWHIAEKEISYKSDVSVPLWIYSVHSKYGKSTEFENEFQKKILLNFIKKNTKRQQFHIYTNSQWAEGFEYSGLFNELFKPSKNLQDVLNFHRNTLGEHYVSMTFRFQQLLGDFEKKESTINSNAFNIQLVTLLEDLKSKSNPREAELQLRAILGDFKNKNISVPLSNSDKTALINKCLIQIQKNQSDSFSEMKILVTADSKTFLDEVSKIKFVYVISHGKIANTDNVNTKFSIFMKAYVDLLMLSGAKELYLLCTESMYRSGFAKNASFINNRVYKEILF